MPETVEVMDAARKTGLEWWEKAILNMFLDDWEICRWKIWSPYGSGSGENDTIDDQEMAGVLWMRLRELVLWLLESPQETKLEA